MRNKRFIAGATCPQCKLLDKIFVYLESDDAGQEIKWRACASCDFSEPFDADAVTPPAEILTRVNQNRVGEQPLAHEVAVEVVKLIDPKNN